VKKLKEQNKKNKKEKRPSECVCVCVFFFFENSERFLANYACLNRTNYPDGCPFPVYDDCWEFEQEWLPNTDQYFLEVVAEYEITAVYIGTEDGIFTGAFAREGGADPYLKSSLLIEDDLGETRHCRLQYNSTEGDAPVRDTSEPPIEDDCNACREQVPGKCYDPRARPWYQKVATDPYSDKGREGVWSPVYSFANGAGLGSPTRCRFSNRRLILSLLCTELI